MVGAIKFSETDQHCSVVAFSELITAYDLVTKVGNWLRKTTPSFWIDGQWLIFSRIVTDFSFANLNSISIEFNNMSFIDYMDYYNNIITINLCCCFCSKKKYIERRLLTEVMVALVNKCMVFWNPIKVDNSRRK